MRKFIMGAAALLLVAAAALPALGQTPGPQTLGEFAAPFREDGAAFNATTRKFSGARGDSGCLARDAQGHRDCLPAGATMVYLPNGKILYWNALEGSEDVQSNSALEGGNRVLNDRSRVLSFNSDPAWLTPINEHAFFGQESGGPNDAIQNDGSLFCSDQKILKDGKVIAVGGTDYYTDQTLTIELEGVKNARIFEPASNTWSKAASMNFARWYPSLVTLGNGKLLVVGGVRKLLKNTDGGNVRNTETYDPEANTWSDNGATAQKSLPLFARIHLLPNGRVYYDAAGQAFNPFGQAYDEALWSLASVYDPNSKSWRDLDIPGLGTPEAGFRGSTFSQMLPLKADDQGRYLVAEFLTGGGVLAPTPGSYLPVADSRIVKVTINATTNAETMATTQTEDMGRARWYSSGVSLPDGSVIAISGADRDEVVTPGREQAIRIAERYDPEDKTWDDLATMSRERTYHNSGVLMADGSVLVGGHAPIPKDYGAVPENNTDGANNFKDASFEIYKPPYLFRGNRPVVGAVPTQLDRGTQLTIPTPDAVNITSVVLMRNIAATHLVDADQRTVVLRILNRDTDFLVVDVPGNPAVLPPGPYLLFVNKGTIKGPTANETFVPSIAKQVFIGSVTQGSGAGTTAPLAATGPTFDTLPAAIALVALGALGLLLLQRRSRRAH